MIRPIALTLLLTLPQLAGCGDAERPRFVPATDDAPTVPAAARAKGNSASGEVTVPKNIPMH